MRPPSSRVERRPAHALWTALCAWLAWLNGDVAYLTFVAHLRRHHPDRTAPSRAEFYRMEVERRWNSIRRCC